jgi:2'-5' RNA ligase
VVKWKGFEEAEDFQSKAAAFTALVNAGIQSPTQAARELNLPVFNDMDIPPYTLTKSGPVFLEDFADPEVRKAQKDAQMAGLELAKTNPGANATQSSQDDQQTGQEEENDAEEGDDKKPSESRPDAKSKQSSDDRVVAPTFVRNDDVQSGMMVAFMLDSQTANMLAIPGAEKPEDMHITLCVLGKTDDDLPVHPMHTLPAISDILTKVAAGQQPLSGKVSGFGRFNPPDQLSPAPIYASVSVDGLVAFREQVVAALQEAGYQIDNTYAYTPHLTLAYVPANAHTPITGVPSVPLYLNAITLCLGYEHHTFDLGEPETTLDGRAASTEYRRWRDVVLKDIKAGKQIRKFQSTIIPPSTLAIGYAALQRCSSASDVRSFFEDMRSIA